MLPWTIGRCYDKLRLESIELLKRVRLNSTRIEHLVEQLYGLNRRLVGEEGGLLRLAETVPPRPSTSATISRASCVREQR